MLVPVICYLFICALLFVIDRYLFRALFDYYFVVFILIDSLVIYCSKEKKSNSDPEPCTGILILLPVQVPFVPVQVHLSPSSI
jgi:hypothetical protein